MLTAQSLFIVSHAIFSLWLYATLLPNPFQNIVLHLLKTNKQTTSPAILNIENLRETVSQIYSLSQAIILSCLPSRNYLTNVFEELS